MTNISKPDNIEYLKTIVISDIHNRYEWIELFLEEHEHDFVVLLGDYFDDFKETRESIKGTAHWLKESVRKPNRIHLLGNHDLFYSVSRHLNVPACSGNTVEKHECINQILTPDDWQQIKLCYFHDGFLYSHAGAHEYWFSHPINGVSLEYIQAKCDDALENLKSGIVDGIFSAGWARGAYGHKPGGILWLDYQHEFKPLKGINQIVGHSPYHMSPSADGVVKYLPNKKRSISTNYCVDFHNKWITFVDDGKVSFRASPINRDTLRWD